MKTLLDNWNPDDTAIPPSHYDSYCKFDFLKEKDKVEAYRRAEVPFIIYNHPEVDEVSALLPTSLHIPNNTTRFDEC